MNDDLKKIPVTSVSGTPPVDTSATTPAVDPEVAEIFDGIQAEMKTRFQLLPEEVQKAIVDEGYQLKLFEIAKTAKLTFEELGILETETTMVLLGMMKPEDYRMELAIQLRKNDAELDPIVKSVNEQVFDPIRAALEKVYRGYREPEDFMPASKIATSGETPIPEVPKLATAPTAAPGSTWTLPTKPIAMPTLSVDDRSVLEKTGVIISETPVQAQAPSLASMPKRSELLENIENPPKAPSSSLIADKLGTTGPIMQAKTTDYSLPKTAPVTPSAAIGTLPKEDPYREKI